MAYCINFHDTFVSDAKNVLCMPSFRAVAVYYISLAATVWDTLLWCSVSFCNCVPLITTQSVTAFPGIWVSIQSVMPLYTKEVYCDVPRWLLYVIISDNNNLVNCWESTMPGSPSKGNNHCLLLIEWLCSALYDDDFRDMWIHCWFVVPPLSIKSSS